MMAVRFVAGRAAFSFFYVAVGFSAAADAVTLFEIIVVTALLALLALLACGACTA